MISRKNILVHEFIGLRVSAQGKAFGKISGVVVDETKNTLVIGTVKGEKAVPKAGAILRFHIGKTKIPVDGNKIAVRPHDRPKKLKGKE